MHKVKIPKKRKGEYRTIYVPDADEKNNCRLLLGDLDKKLKKLCDKDIIHGFCTGKSPVTNAKMHIGFIYSLCFDLADFFDSVTESKVNSFLSEEEKKICLVEGAARQGLPTSPVIANIAGITMDKAIKRFLKKNVKEKVVYTRYADDLTFSFNDKTTYEILKEKIPNIISKCGFKVNNKKTRLQCSHYGRREITGVMVDKDNIYVSRKVKRRLRAAKHQNNTDVARGLEEWSKLKEPNPENKNKHNIYTIQSEVNSLRKLWKISHPIKVKDLPKKKDEKIGKNIIITGDPVYILGASSFTNNKWRSCFSFPRGLNRLATLILNDIEGVRIAILQGDEDSIIGNVTRKVIDARAWVYEDENGLKFYDKIYGKSNEAINKLRDSLDNAGYKPITSRPDNNITRIQVKGNTKRRSRFYSDSLNLVDDTKIVIKKRDGTVVYGRKLCRTWW